MRNDPNMRTVNVDWGERVPKLHFVLDQERLQLIGLSPEAAAQQLQFLLNGQTITQVREDIRAVNIVARSAGPERLDPAKLENFTLTTRNGKPIPLSQIGRVEIQVEFVLDQQVMGNPTIGRFHRSGFLGCRAGAIHPVPMMTVSSRSVS